MSDRPESRAVRRARALSDRAKATTGFNRWSSHYPPPAMQDMVEAMDALLEEIAALHALEAGE